MDFNKLFATEKVDSLSSNMHTCICLQGLVTEDEVGQSAVPVPFPQNLNSWFGCNRHLQVCDCSPQARLILDARK
eukprot:scaffold128028_cov18-Tisochrysis_lutea.AAC.1